MRPPLIQLEVSALKDNPNESKFDVLLEGTDQTLVCSCKENRININVRQR